MSPEQATLDGVDVDTRSDVYSLGALLYALLTGSPPLGETSARGPLLDALRRVREEEPCPPSARLGVASGLAHLAAARNTVPVRLIRALKGDLDRVVMKALEKDRSRRYQSAGELAADVQRYLADEPVLARPTSLGDRLRKLARRNKGRLAAAAAVALGLLVAAGGVGWALGDRAARQAEADRERGERSARLAERVGQALADADRLVQAQRWGEAREAARRAEAALAAGEAEEAVRDRVAGLVRDIQFVDRLEQAHEVASVWKEGGFDFAGADAAFRDAFRDFGIDPESPGAAEAFQTRHGRIARPVADALDLWVYARRVLPGAAGWPPLAALANRLDPDPVRARLRDSWSRPADPSLLAELQRLADTAEPASHGPSTLALLALRLQKAGLAGPAERVLRRAQREFPGDFWVNLNLANALHSTRKWAEGAQFARAAVAVRPGSLAALNNLGNLLLETGQLDEATACFRRAVALDPGFELGHRNLGRALAMLGDHGGAAASSRRALELRPGELATYSQLALTLRRQGDVEGAARVLRRAVEIAPADSRTLTNLGNVLTDLHRGDEAVACFRKAIESDPDNASAHINLGNALLRQPKAAEACFRKAIEIEPGSANAHNGLAGALAKQGRFDEAVATLRKAVSLDPAHAASHRNLGQVLALRGRLDEAAGCYRKAAELSPKNPADQLNLGTTLRRLGRHDEALACARRAVELAPNSPVALEELAIAAGRCERWREALDARLRLAKAKPPGTADKYRLAAAHWRAGNKAEARQWHAEATAEAARLKAPDKAVAEARRAADALLAGVAEKPK